MLKTNLNETFLEFLPSTFSNTEDGEYTTMDYRLKTPRVINFFKQCVKLLTFWWQEIISIILNQWKCHWRNEVMTQAYLRWQDKSEIRPSVPCKPWHNGKAWKVDIRGTLILSHDNCISINRLFMLWYITTLDTT